MHRYLLLKQRKLQEIDQAQGLLNDLKGQANIPAPVLAEAEAAVEGTTTDTTTDADATAATTAASTTTAALGTTDTTTTTADTTLKLGGVEPATPGIGKILVEKYDYKVGSDGLYYAPGRSFPEGVTDSATAAPADTPTDAVDVTTPAAPTPDVPTTEADATAAADIAGSAIISPGTPSAPTAVSPDLDNAQAAYADAQKS